MSKSGSALTLGVTLGLGAYVLGMIAFLQFQWHKLKCSDVSTTFTTGLVRTVADLLEEHRDPGLVAQLLERNRFRSVKICAFAPNGDVLLDSAEPCATKDLQATTASTRQLELYRAIMDAEQKKPHGPVTSGVLYRPCDASGSGDAQLTTFTSVRDPKWVVAATSCGHED